MAPRTGASTSSESMLTQLVKQGLVKQHPNNEFTVKFISAPELLQINEALFINESAALRLAMIHGDHSWESQIVALHDQLSQTPEYVDTDHTIINESWTSLHNQFHRALLSGCNNTFLLDLCLRLWGLSELINRDGSIQRHPDRNIAAEHHSLMEAVLARDIDQALKRYQEHMLSL